MGQERLFRGNCPERYETWCASLVGPAGGGFGFTPPGKALCGIRNGFEVLFCATKVRGLWRRARAPAWQASDETDSSVMRMNRRNHLTPPLSTIPRQTGALTPMSMFRFVLSTLSVTCNVKIYSIPRDRPCRGSALHCFASSGTRRWPRFGHRFARPLYLPPTIARGLLGTKPTEP